MNLKVIAALVLLIIAGIFGVSSFRKSMTPYVSFHDARQASGLVQVNGVLADKNYVLKKDEQYLEFKLRDSRGEILPVAVQRGAVAVTGQVEFERDVRVGDVAGRQVFGDPPFVEEAQDGIGTRKRGGIGQGHVVVGAVGTVHSRNVDLADRRA